MSDTWLNRIDPGLRADLPDLGFQRRLDGAFLFFPSWFSIKGGYEVPESELSRVAIAASNLTRGCNWSLAPLILWVVGCFFWVPLLAGHLPQPSGPADVGVLSNLDALLPAVVLTGLLVILCLALAWNKRCVAKLVETELGGLRFDPEARRVPRTAHEGLWLACSLSLFLGLLGLGGVIAGFDLLVSELQTGAWIAAWNGFLFIVMGAGLIVLAVWSLAGRGTASAGWQRLEQWAFDSDAVSALETSDRARPVWKKLLVPRYGMRLGLATASMLEFLHVLILYGVPAILLLLGGLVLWDDLAGAEWKEGTVSFIECFMTLFQ